MERRPDLVGIAIGGIEMPITRHAQQLRQVLLSQAERRATFRNARLARFAKRNQRIDRRRIGRAVWPQGRKQMRPHRATHVRAIATPVPRKRQRPIKRLTLQIKRLIIVGSRWRRVTHAAGSLVIV